MQTLRPHALLSLSLGLIITLPQLQAGALQLTSPDQLSSTDVTAQFPGLSGTELASPLTVTAGSASIRYALSDSSASFYRFDSNGQTNAFPAGTGLIDTNGAYGPYTRIFFDGGTSEFGFLVQSAGIDTVTFTLSAFNGESELLDFTVGPIDNSTGRGQTAFIGARATDGDLFTRLQISSVSNDSDYSNFLIFGPTTLAAPAAATPEPSAFVLLGLGCLCLATKMKRQAHRG